MNRVFTFCILAGMLFAQLYAADGAVFLRADTLSAEKREAVIQILATKVASLTDLRCRLPAELKEEFGASKSFSEVMQALDKSSVAFLIFFEAEEMLSGGIKLSGKAFSTRNAKLIWEKPSEVFSKWPSENALSLYLTEMASILKTSKEARPSGPTDAYGYQSTDFMDGNRLGINPYAAEKFHAKGYVTGGLGVGGVLAVFGVGFAIAGVVLNMNVSMLALGAGCGVVAIIPITVGLSANGQASVKYTYRF